MSEHVLAVATYSAQKVMHPRTQGRVSAHKIGYSSAAADVLLAIYRGAEEVSSSRASYRYIRLEGVVARHGYLLIKVSAEKLAQAELVTRASHRAGVYLWRDGKWWSLPTRDQAAYAEPGYQTAPSFDPAGYLAYSAENGERESAVEGVHAERTQRSSGETPWWWMSGDTYPHRDLLRQQGCRWSKKRRAWYFVGWKLPGEINALITAEPPEEEADTDDELALSPELERQILDILGQDDTANAPASQAAVEPSEPSRDSAVENEKPPAVRVIKPTPFPADGETLDPVQTAIRDATLTPPAAIHTAQGPSHLSPISHAYCGELTGSITGNVYCYGYAVHDGVLVYLNMAGPRMAVEAIRAKLSKGEQVSLVPPDAPSVELTAGEGNTGMYHAYLHYLPEARFTSLILVHDWAVTPNYGGKATTFLFRTSDAQAVAKLKHHVTQLVNIPVFEAWGSYLYRAGQTAMLVRTSRSGGGIDLLSIDLDIDVWTRLITGGIEQRIIILPNNA